MKITPFTEVKEDVEKAADWLSYMGLDFLKTRIGEYRKNINLLNIGRLMGSGLDMRQSD